METAKRVQLIVSDVLEIAPETIRAESHQADIAEWDSLAQLRIVTALEQEFGVKPTMREITELTSIPAITRYLDGSRSQ